MQRGGALRDDTKNTKNGCVADYRYHKSCIIPLGGGGGVFILSTLEGGLYNRERGLFLEANNFGRENTYQKV